jgi:uncharacterized membrane protein
VNQLVVAVFPDETKAYETARALEDPSDPVHAAVRGMAIIVKHADGTVSEKKWTSQVAYRAPVGALVGALLGLAAGPLGSAIGFTAGGLLGFSRDLANFGIEESFFNDVAAKLTPGTSALVIEVAKDADLQLEARLKLLGASVMLTDLTP